MKKRLKALQIKGFVAGVIVTVMLTATVAFANTGGVMRELLYGVSINLNGQVLELADIDRPFIIDGRTFLPVRAISEALDIPIEWHGATRTVYVGTIPHGAPFWTTVPPFESSRMQSRTVNMLGNAYASSIAAPAGHGGSAHISWSHHNLNGQFNTITGTIGREDGSGNGSRNISFIGDGRPLASFSVDGSTIPTDISVDVRGVLVLRVEIQAPSNPAGGARIAFANAMIQ